VDDGWVANGIGIGNIVVTDALKFAIDRAAFDLRWTLGEMA